MATVTTAPIAVPESQQRVTKVNEPAPGRVLSLDVFRGLTMILLISHGFGLYEAFRQTTANGQALQWFAQQLDHAEWVGCTLWDLIQPAFTFIVGAAMPFALGRRRQQGATTGQLFRHVLWRAVLLILLSNVLSNWTSAGR